MRYVDELRHLLVARFPEFGAAVKDMHEGQFMGAVATAFKTKPDVNPTDFAMKIIGMINNGDSPSDGDGASGVSKAPKAGR